MAAILSTTLCPCAFLDNTRGIEMRFMHCNDSILHQAYSNTRCSDHVNVLNHWGRVTHICVSKLTIIGSDNGLSPGRRQAIIWTNTGILLIGPIGTNFSEILIEIYIFSFEKIHLKMSHGKWRPFCLGLNVLRTNPNQSLDIQWLLLIPIGSFAWSN